MNSAAAPAPVREGKLRDLWRRVESHDRRSGQTIAEMETRQTTRVEFPARGVIAGRNR